MLSRSFVCAVVLLGLLTPTAHGQVTPDQAQELRSQIEELQRQLMALEAGGQNKKGVAQVGGSRPRARDPVVNLRLYDLSDLFAVAPAYEAMHESELAPEQVSPIFPSLLNAKSRGMTGGMGGGGGFYSIGGAARATVAQSQQTLSQFGAESGNLAESRASVDNLIAAIKTTIAPDTWDDVGGPGYIARLGNSLLISSDDETHGQIEALLNLFRERWGTLRTISLRAYWIWLDDSRLAHLLAAPEEAAEGADMPKGFGVVSAANWQELMAELELNSEFGYRAALTCYNGQTVHALSGGQSLAVTQLEPLAHPDDENRAGHPTAYRPVVSVLQQGAALQITPLANASGKYVVLDIHSRVIQTKESNEDPFKEKISLVAEPTVRQVVDSLDRPRLMTHRISTTLRVPVDRPMLIGGMTYDREPAPGSVCLYLFVKVSVQELRDDQSSVSRRRPGNGIQEVPPGVEAPETQSDRDGSDENH